VKAAGLEARVRLHRALLPRDPAPRARYDLVVSNSLLHHLHEPAGFWSVVQSVAAPGAQVFVMDLMRPKDDATVAALLAEHAAGEPEVLVRDFDASLRAAFTVAEVEAQLAAAGLPGLHVQAVSDRHLTVTGRL
jgi:2-polyprenyl-3-methyl-5-hydroxy-6-metoxy-1,4-benzoquinol methylase